MRARKAAIALLSIAILGGALLVPSAQAATPKPAWDIHSLATPTVFKPGETSGLDRYEVVLTNIGAEVSDGSPIQIADTLPAGLGVKAVELLLIQPEVALPVNFGPAACETQTVGEVSTVSCEISESLPKAVKPALLYASMEALLVIHLEVPPSASGPLTNSVTVKGGGAGEAAATSHNEAGEGEAPAGLQHFGAALTGSDGKPATGADSHPYEQTTSFALNTVLTPPGTYFPFRPAEGDLKNVEVALPPGLVGNPTAATRCTAQQFNTITGVVVGGGLAFQNECPDASAVGLAIVQQLEGEVGINPAPIYNLVPPKGMPAQFGFQVLGFPIYIDTKLRGDSDYGVTAYLQNTTEAKRVTAASVTIWGVPGEEGHDPQRGHCLAFAFGFSIGNCPSGIPVKPFLRLPSSCESPLQTTMRFDTWLHPGTFQEALFEEPAPTDCDLPDFSPSIEAKPTTDVADAPSGLHFDLHLPQAANEAPAGLGEADLRDATVTLPEGLLPNPAFATGREACSAAQIGLTSPLGQSSAHFSADPPECPDASKLGAVAVDTPLIDHPLPGAVYLANPHENPFDSLLAIYIAVSDPQTGVVVKLAGQVEPDPVTGQLTTTVKESPQTPFEDFKLDFFEGARAPLRTPAVCGTHTTTTDLKPWTSPAFGPDATPSDSFQITTGAGGGACPTTPSGEPNSPNFEAGTATPVAGAFSPFILHLARQDGSQEIKGVNVDLPPGLTGKLAGLTYCSDASLASAASKSGKAEQGSPSCPSSSQLGTVTVGAGAGPAPFYAQGKAYLAGPYKGAPISMAILTPAVAGPFDLGTVVVRAALNVDPETARIHAVSDPIPTILDGIPLDVRSIALHVDRDQFTLNPTSCNPFAFSGQALSALNQSANLTQRFQVGGCSSLGFKPKLSLKLKGGAKRGDHPALTATLTMPPGGANIASAQVALPHSEFLDQAHIRTICTRVQFAANACPSGAIYGFAKAFTPLLDKPLEGPVYLRSSSHKLPDVVADLNGQIHIVLDGRVDSIHGGIRNTFEATPDAPVSKFTLSLKGGKKGLLINSRDICGGVHRATADFTAQSGKVSDFRPAVEAKCGGAS